jgi:putative FmdB family regulatory protein
MTWKVRYFQCPKPSALAIVMPTYEYRCPKGHQFEHFFRTISSAERHFKCPECGEMGERIMSGGSGLVFKGSGFYITDYGKDGKKDQRKAAETKSESSGESGSKSSTEKSGTDKSGADKSSKGSGSGDA